MKVIVVDMRIPLEDNAADIEWFDVIDANFRGNHAQP